MFEELLLTVELEVPFDAFERLPRHPAYKYEYFGGRAVLSPRPHYVEAVLDLSGGQDFPLHRDKPREEVMIRRLEVGDWGDLAPAFAAAFTDLPPFTVLDSGIRRRAAEACLERTRAGLDGQLIPGACFVATRARSEPKVVGGVLVTLVARDQLFAARHGGASQLSGADPLPHLTWIFVSLLDQRGGAGTALLSAVVRELRAQGYDQLVSTILVGNGRSLIWHWRCGFRVLAAL